MRSIVGLVLVSLLGLLIADWVYQRYHYVYVSDARVQANIIAISSQIPGHINDIPVQTGQPVEVGSTLLQLDAREAQLRIDQLGEQRSQLQAELNAAKQQRRMTDLRSKAALERQQAALQVHLADIEKARARLQLAEKNLLRSNRLGQQGSISVMQIDRDENARDQARESLRSAEASLTLERATLRQAEADRLKLQIARYSTESLKAQIAQVEAMRQASLVNLEHHYLKSPVDAVIDKKFVNPGEYAMPGQRLIMLHNPKQLWINAKIKETDLRHIDLNARVFIDIDAFPGKTLTGRVTRIGDAATNQFALLPNPNPSGNFTKITQRLELRIDLDEQYHKLRPGMMVELKITIDR